MTNKTPKDFHLAQLKISFEAMLKRIGMSQSELAKSCGYTDRAITKWKNTGKYPLWVQWIENGINGEKGMDINTIKVQEINDNDSFINIEIIVNGIELEITADKNSQEWGWTDSDNWETTEANANLCKIPADELWPFIETEINKLELFN